MRGGLWFWSVCVGGVVGGVVAAAVGVRGETGGRGGLLEGCCCCCGYFWGDVMGGGWS